MCQNKFQEIVQKAYDGDQDSIDRLRRFIVRIAAKAPPAVIVLVSEFVVNRNWSAYDDLDF